MSMEIFEGFIGFMPLKCLKASVCHFFCSICLDSCLIGIHKFRDVKMSPKCLLLVETDKRITF